MMRVTWLTNLGELEAIREDAEAVELIEALKKLDLPYEAVQLP